MISNNDDDDENPFAKELERLRVAITKKLPDSTSDKERVKDFLNGSDLLLDDDLVKFVVLRDATPEKLAAFAQQGPKEANMIENMLLGDTQLMKQMLIADGPRGKNTQGAPPEYGRAMQIYTDIQNAVVGGKSTAESSSAFEGGVFRGGNNNILQRLALAISLVHAVPVEQSNPINNSGANTPSEIVDPVARYLHYEKALQNGELDEAFPDLTTWELTMVIDGDEPENISTWGRQMLQNYHPDFASSELDYKWRYVKLVNSDVRYGSGDVPNDRPELQRYQNILMNGGVCGRRAFFGRFILRAFGIPTTARPQTGHAALVHYTPNKGWLTHLGGGWGSGWTKTRYGKDLDFLATTQARRRHSDHGEQHDMYLMVKRAQWAGDVLGEERFYGEHQQGRDTNCGFWYDLSLKTQRAIIDGENHNISSSSKNENLPYKIVKEQQQKPTTRRDKIITLNKKGNNLVVTDKRNDGAIVIPADSYSKCGNDIQTIDSFHSSCEKQIELGHFASKGLTILRGGSFKEEAGGTYSGRRLLSAGYGQYSDWGFRLAFTSDENGKNYYDRPSSPPCELVIEVDLSSNGSIHGSSSMAIEFVYVKPGNFLMGGEVKKDDGRFDCVEVPKHEVTLTHGYYLGKYPVTQEQYLAIMGKNPSKSSHDTNNLNCPVDNIGLKEANQFCEKLSEAIIGKEIRLPTEAEWEYASRGGSDGSNNKWFFGNDASQLGEYAWYAQNSGGKSHPVGQKKPNQFGLHDIYGNVWERTSDTYARDYYAKSPQENPTGPSEGTYAHLEYQVVVPRSGEYSLTANVVTLNYNQTLSISTSNDDDNRIPVSANDDYDLKNMIVMNLPFTCGSWQESNAVTVILQKGTNTLRFLRDKPPQYGIAVRRFTLLPLRTTSSTALCEVVSNATKKGDKGRNAESIKAKKFCWKDVHQLLKPILLATMILWVMGLVHHVYLFQ